MTSAQPVDAADQQRDFFHQAATRVAQSQLAKLIAAWEQHTGKPVTEDMRKAFVNIIWQCSSVTVATLLGEFSTTT